MAPSRGTALEIANQLNDRGRRQLQPARDRALADSIDQAWHYTYGFAFGGDFFDEAACAVTPTDAANVAAFQWLYDSSRRARARQSQRLLGCPQGWPRSPRGAGSVPHRARRRSTSPATGSSPIAANTPPTSNFGLTIIPVPEEGAESATWAGGWSVVIPQGAKNPEGGWQFMQYIAGEAGQRTYTTETAHLPTLRRS